MPEALAETAAKKTCTALAEATGKVRVLSFVPFQVQPSNVLDLTFKDVAIEDDVAISIFKRAIASLVSSDLRPRILGQDLDPSSRILQFSKFLEALLAERELGGGE